MNRIRSRRSRAGILTALLMFSPYAILLVVFGIMPIVSAFATSFRPSLANPQGGPANYLLVLQDFRFLPAVGNVATFIAIYVPAMVIVVALMSLLLDSARRRWTIALRTAFIVPAAISGSVSILVWYFMLEPQFSPFAGLMASVGITEGTQIWNASNLVGIFVLMAFFTGAGYWIVIQYGSLQSIPDEVLDAARIDGANAIQTGLLIKLPLIKKYLVYMGILSFAAALQIFVEPYLISTTVYPGLAANWSLNQLSYSLAFDSANLGAASALSLMLLAVCIAASLVVIFRTDFFDEADVRTRRKASA